MRFEKEVQRLESLVCFSPEESEIRKNVICSIRDSNYTYLWDNYCTYQTYQRNLGKVNSNAVEIVSSICKEIKPAGYYIKGYNENKNS